MTELADYDYELPRELIAQHPLATRSDARLMIVDRARQMIDHAYIRDLPELLRPRDLLVVNDTRVIPARLVGRRERTGARWTGLFLQADEHGAWQILSKTRGKLEAGESIQVLSWDLRQSTRLRLLTKLEGGVWVVRPEPLGDPLEVLQQVGRVPLPPYIRDGEMTDEDEQAYQTVFAQTAGAVAAPTAGLHFTPELLSKLEKAGITRAAVTLHVGVGTFRPVTAERLEDHVMHQEWASLGQETLQKIVSTRANAGRVIAVGTTVVRTLESAVNGGVLQPFTGQTDLFIRPPHHISTIDGLLTNFHLPKSTLLVLVRTFGGDQLIRRAYQRAIEQQYRFFSYGDAMLII
ncbi:S-adenosylmethionine:tRNA ribosyltransferase-isomerase [Anatilimnocola aggregata]|uniref:S-adenosylmethionine:tRNA ribosyltransferase-isomerase n=1 Tax=Anatilimnocola aggregata TaxID=2528021 RepID=A0A517YDJ7_9BACT|nr:tRNA preQ1(34) S-adenosylmethionine ribosyltransferase-isomerase QueA [Anatilimnocola aggregata]QDU28316.1 S-adenosylmethionine:tRNA ribosyltransferase-isomerase [Anatilimnocola aggregata]